MQYLFGLTLSEMGISPLLLAIIISLIVGFVLLVNKKRKLLASIILVFSLSLIAALIIDMIIF